jgi:transcriptional regulator with XRE-family HTH domain/mannose-6-phosphate isomerase-like protein (cupin superfamily)
VALVYSLIQRMYSEAVNSWLGETEARVPVRPDERSASRPGRPGQPGLPGLPDQGSPGSRAPQAGWHPGTELGPRLRRVRQDRRLSARELASRVNCSASLISQIERGLSAPSAGILYALATELGTSLDYLFGVTAEDVLVARAGAAAGAAAAGPVASPVAGLAAGAAGPAGGGWDEAEAGLRGHGVVQRLATRRVIELASGVRWERLTPAADDRVDFLEVRYEPGGHSTDSRQLLRHDGYEYGLITSGTLRATVGFESYELEPGDSIAFDSATPHEYWNTSGAEVRAVWVVVHAVPGRA